VLVVWRRDEVTVVFAQTDHMQVFNTHMNFLFNQINGVVIFSY
jgi:hypothetical protein